MAEQRNAVHLRHKDTGDTVTVPEGSAEVLKKNGWVEHDPDETATRRQSPRTPSSAQKEA